MSNTQEKTFLSLIQDVISNGIEEKNDRTGVGIKFLPPTQLKFSLENNILPLFQTREIYWKNVFWEMIWILRGETNIKFLKEKNVNIWDSWSDKDGNLGFVYGHLLRKNNGDQLKYVIDQLKTNPASRRIVFTLWDSSLIDKQALPPCHGNAFQFIIDNNKKELYASVTCRSTDLILGAPVNIAEWSLFTHLIAKMTGFKAKEITINFNFPHVYLNHIEQAKKWLNRETNQEFPTINIKKDINTILDLENLVIEDVELIDYTPIKPNIKFQVAV